MRVLQVYRTYFPDPPGGLQEAIRQICLATEPLGVENTIFALSPQAVPCQLTRPEGNVVRCRSWVAPASCDVGGITTLRHFSTLAHSSEIVQYHFPWPFADLLHLAARPKAPAIMTFHSDIVRQRWLGKAYAPLMRHTLRSMRIIVANCPAYAQTSPVLSDPAIRDKVRVIPLGIVEESYSAVGDETIFTRLNLAKEEPFFLFVGVLRYYKGLHFLIKAARQVKARIVIAGVGPELEKLRSLAECMASDNVLFAGQVSDAEKVSLIRQSLAMVLPSHLRSEAFGMVLIEASIFGRPLISCEIGTGTSFVNVHEETGFIVPPEDPDALANAMNVLLQETYVAKTLGQGARARYEALFSGPALGQAYASLFREVAG